MTKCDFNKLALQHLFLRTAFSKTTYGWLLLKMGVLICGYHRSFQKTKRIFCQQLERFESNICFKTISDPEQPIQVLIWLKTMATVQNVFH